ncbi:hypothetical protein X975_02729, partial [Stegodyphus mimosarum]
FVSFGFLARVVNSSHKFKPSLKYTECPLMYQSFQLYLYVMYEEESCFMFVTVTL